MAYIGNTAETQGFIPAVDFFSGNGVTTAFTLSRPVASVAQVQATIENVPQNPGTAFTVSGNTITFDGAPASGTNNIYVYYTSPITQVIQPSQGTVGTAQLASNILVSPTYVSDQLNASTGYFDLPVGTTAQRPGSPVVGMIRYNTTESQYEVYRGTTWQIVSTSGYPYSVDYLIIAGGGAGGGGYSGANGGGGGAGGYRTGSETITSGLSYTVTVGAGAASAAANAVGGNGSNSVFSSITSTGGGGGGTNASYNVSAGVAGGSGGGGYGGAISGVGTGGAGTAGQGFAGGNSATGAGGGVGGGGGGGASAVGSAGSGTTGGAGGAGSASSITGSSVTRAGGGGGGSNATAGAGGAGGGGNGGSATAGFAGTANTGGGGGGGASIGGGAGGSGVVIISYPGAQRGTGGTVTSSGGNTIHTFTSSGTYTA
jgi:hypothetical protein